MNIRLVAAISRAKEHSLPKANIDGAIARGSTDASDYEDIVYEGYVGNLHPYPS
jgi:transcriptional/translational regulatory protein YebC/TACO1